MNTTHRRPVAQPFKALPTRGKSGRARQTRRAIFTHVETFDKGDEGDDEGEGGNWTKYNWRKNRKPPNCWDSNDKTSKSGGHSSNRKKNDLGQTSDLTYKVRYLLSKADTLYNKGDFESALLFYHKGRKLRPKAEEFRLGVVKAEQALEASFTLRAVRKKNSQSEPDTQQDSKLDKEKEQKQGKEKTEDETKQTEETRENANEAEDTTKGQAEKEQTASETKNTKGKNGKRSVKQNQEKEHDIEKKGTGDQDKAADDAKNVDDEKESPENENKEHAEEDKEQAESYESEGEPVKKPALPKPEPHRDRIERIREMRLAYSIREREEARKSRIRMQMLTRPTQHLQDDQQFLETLYKDFTAGTKNRKMKRVTKEAINYLDTRNRFWKQQIPHHIRERSTVMKKQDPSKAGPPPTQALYAFVIKEMIRINNMLEKNQYHRCIDNAKKLIDHINQMERNIPNKFNILANLFSIIGQAYLELGDCKKSLAFHMKDLQLSTELDLDEAKSRALDNTGRVFARTGEFAKAIAVWEQKLAAPFPIAPGEKAWLCHELGYCYIELEIFEKARECGENSLAAAKETEDKKWQMNAAILIAQSLLHAGEAYLSKDAFEKALSLALVAEDTKAKESIEQALEEIKKVIAKWKEIAKDHPPPARNEPPKPISDTPRESSTKSHRTQSDWLLDDDVTEDASGSSVNNGQQNTDRDRKTDLTKSETDSIKYTKRKSVAAVYIGGKDSDFAITTSAESADDEKQANKRSGNESETNRSRNESETTRTTKDSDIKRFSKEHGTKRFGKEGESKRFGKETETKRPSDKSESKSNFQTSNKRPPKEVQSNKTVHDRNSRWDYTNAKREVSFSRSPKASPSRSPQRESSFATKPRQEASFIGNPKRDNSYNFKDKRPPMSPEEKIARTTTIYTYSRELSNVSARTSIKREKSNISLRNSRKNKSTTDLSRNTTVMSPGKRRKSKGNNTDKNSASNTFLTDRS